MILPGGEIVGEAPSQKRVEHEYDYSDLTDYTVMGAGPTKITVHGVCGTEEERHAVVIACNVRGEQRLYFPSADGAPDDRYYRIHASPPVWTMITASDWEYSFVASTVVPYKYDAATDERVT